MSFLIGYIIRSILWYYDNLYYYWRKRIVDLDYAIRLCRTIGECEVGTIKKMAIERLITEIEKSRNQQ